MMTAYAIREARPKDLDDLYAVFSLTDSMHREAHPEIFQEASDLSDIKVYLLTRIKADDAAVFVAEYQSNIIGAVIASVRQTPDYSILVQQTYVGVENLVVEEAFRHQGVGQALMDQVNQWVEKLGLKYIELTVWDFNAGAQAFYEKLGYQTLHHRLRKDLP